MFEAALANTIAPHEGSPGAEMAWPDRGAGLAMLLTQGGDGRIRIDAASGRNRYGVPPRPSPDEVWFSSSTASACSARGFRAAHDALARLGATAPARRTDPRSWFDRLRTRLLTLTGSPGAEAILCASGTETELLALTLAQHVFRRPIVNIVVARQETGAGVMEAAAGSHFAAGAAHRESVDKGTPLAGWEDKPVRTREIDIRRADGRLRPAADVDRDVGDAVETAIAAGFDVQLHVLDTSKTGQSGPTRGVAASLLARHPDRLAVVVDACQLRCGFAQIAADLEAGFLVMVTGSKFAGGPPFCGALLVPDVFAARLAGLAVPVGLAAYTAAYDWPPALRGALDGGAFQAFNLGLGLRWEAALSEMEAYALCPAADRARIVAAFADAVQARVAARPHLKVFDIDAASPVLRMPTMIPIVSRDGAPAEAFALHAALREPLPGGGELDRAVHLGQPVVVAGIAALRVCIGMPTINAVAERMASTGSADALAALIGDLDRAFGKWDLLDARNHR